jgi:hypothetical protein
LNMFGHNFKQNFDTPFGIYAYPIKNITSDYNTDLKYAYVFKNKKNGKWIQDISKMERSECSRCYDIIRKELFDDNFEYQKQFSQHSSHSSGISSSLSYLFLQS